MELIHAINERKLNYYHNYQLTHYQQTPMAFLFYLYIKDYSYHRQKEHLH